MVLLLLMSSLALADEPTTGCTVDGEAAPCPSAPRLGSELATDSGLYLVAEAHGDGCPTMYRLVCTKRSKVSSSFGTCAELAGVDVKGQAIRFRFDAEPDAKREARTYVTAEACTVTAE